MAGEIVINAGIVYTNSCYAIPAVTLKATDYADDIAGKHFVNGTLSLTDATGGTAIPMGSLGTLGWAVYKNTSTAGSGAINLQSTAGGPIFARLMVGRSIVVRHALSTAPFAFATTSDGAGVAPSLEYLQLEV